MDYLPLEGSVDLKTPHVEWWYIEFWGLDPTQVPDSPEDVLFGRWVCMRDQILRYICILIIFSYAMAKDT